MKSTMTNNSERPSSWTIATDFGQSPPITDMELDAIEAFLMTQVRALLQDEKRRKDSPETKAADSELPQSLGQILLHKLVLEVM